MKTKSLHNSSDDLNELAAKLAKGDAMAIAQIYKQTYVCLLHFGLQVVGKHQQSLVEGTIQELFIWLAKNYQQVGAIQNFEAYLYQSLRRNLVQKLQVVKAREKTKNRFLRRTKAIEDTATISPEADNTKVFLEEGKIKLTTVTQNLTLLPNDFINYTIGQTELATMQKTIKNADISWKEGTLLLTQLTVAEILQRLEEIYGYSFEVKRTSILAERKTLAIPMDKLEIILPILERTLDEEIEKEGTTLKLN